MPTTRTAIAATAATLSLTLAAGAAQNLAATVAHPDFDVPGAGNTQIVNFPDVGPVNAVGMTALCGILNYLSRLWSKAAFKRLVHEVVTEYQWPFEENMVLTREIGKLLGVPQRDDDTVESYVSRIRHHLKIPLPLPPTSEGRPRRASRLG